MLHHKTPRNTKETTKHLSSTVGVGLLSGAIFKTEQVVSVVIVCAEPNPIAAFPVTNFSPQPICNLLPHQRGLTVAVKSDRRQPQTRIVGRGCVSLAQTTAIFILLSCIHWASAQTITWSGVDAENEIDIEFSKWNHTGRGCNADFTVYSSTGNHKPDRTSAWEDNFDVSGGAITTARIEWASEHIVFTLMNGARAIGTTAEVFKTETYASDKKDIPQRAVPVGINLWCFRETPARTQSVIIRSFEFAPG